MEKGKTCGEAIRRLLVGQVRRGRPVGLTKTISYYLINEVFGFLETSVKDRS